MTHVCADMRYSVETMRSSLQDGARKRKVEADSLAEEVFALEHVATELERLGRTVREVFWRCLPPFETVDFALGC